jgi:hypothetical protein
MAQHTLYAGLADPDMEEPVSVDGVPRVTSFTDDLKSALDDAIRSRSPQLDAEVLGHIGLTGDEYGACRV